MEDQELEYRLWVCERALSFLANDLRKMMTCSFSTGDIIQAYKEKAEQDLDPIEL